MHMDQMILFKKIDRKRMEENPEDDDDCCAHECKHCKTLLSFPWKINRIFKSKHFDGPGAYHSAHAARHLEKHCDEVDRASTEQRTTEKGLKKQHTDNPV